MTESVAELIARRRKLLGANVQTFYEEPVHLVKGEGVWVWDAEGRRYLDCYNNVPHVGHCHPFGRTRSSRERNRSSCSAPAPWRASNW
jgi:4-aminobutyrate aminotransferase-like enzyme